MNNWKCATCAETDIREQDPRRPWSCRWCPERTATTRVEDGRLVVAWYLDGRLHGRSLYQNNADGQRAARRKVIELAKQGYDLK